MAYKGLHRITGVIVSFFIAAHLFNHLMAWYGIAEHQRILDALRVVYRNRVGEVLLIGCFLFQACSGVKLIGTLRKKEKMAAIEKVQIWSGIAFGLFILQHIAATVSQRLYFKFDTNFYFAARVVLQSPWKYYFIPYYFGGIMSLAVHVAAVHRKKVLPAIGAKRAKIHFWVIILLLAAIACIILYVFSGGRYNIIIPKEYNIY